MSLATCAGPHWWATALRWSRPPWWRPGSKPPTGDPVAATRCRAICWTAIWDTQRDGTGHEHLLLSEDSADSLVLAFDEQGQPFRLAYQLAWDETSRLRAARLLVTTERATRSLHLETDGAGHWRSGDGRGAPGARRVSGHRHLAHAVTNTFPILRQPLALGERREFVMAWVSAPELTIRPMRQGYTQPRRQRLPRRAGCREVASSWTMRACSAASGELAVNVVAGAGAVRVTVVRKPAGRGAGRGGGRAVQVHLGHGEDSFGPSPVGWAERRDRRGAGRARDDEFEAARRAAEGIAHGAATGAGPDPRWPDALTSSGASWPPR